MRVSTLFILATALSFGQNSSLRNNSNVNPPIELRHSLGSSFFMLGNFLSDSPDYYLLTYGYRLSQKDRIFVEFNTWKYAEPLGTYGHSSENYPGFVRAIGVGIGFQRFHWKGLFTIIEATPFSKQYYNVNDDKTQKGFQLYLQFITGYRFEFFNNRWYVEPAYALKYWPVDTNFPTDFATIEQGNPKYKFEPSLNFGFKF
tara:strand:+ start:1518 stop:2120 length:603 start_codon:yes stop_codon:yes gene_type:complete